MIRAVLDANVLVSGLISRKGAPAEILDALRDGKFHLLLSRSILEELHRVLQYPKVAARLRLPPEELELFIIDIVDSAILTSGQLALAVVAQDASDNRYLECAVEGDADFIVSGDRHLLRVGNHQGVELLTPREFAGLLATG